VRGSCVDTTEPTLSMQRALEAILEASCYTTNKNPEILRQRTTAHRRPTPRPDQRQVLDPAVTSALPAKPLRGQVLRYRHQHQRHSRPRKRLGQHFPTRSESVLLCWNGSDWSWKGA